MSFSFPCAFCVFGEAEDYCSTYQTTRVRGYPFTGANNESLSERFNLPPFITDQSSLQLTAVLESLGETRSKIKDASYISRRTPGCLAHGSRTLFAKSLHRIITPIRHAFSTSQCTLPSDHLLSYLLLIFLQTALQTLTPLGLRSQIVPPDLPAASCSSLGMEWPAERGRNRSQFAQFAD